MSRHPWDIWMELTCQWDAEGSEDDLFFSTGCDLGEITIDMGPSIRYCPGCGKPIDCFDFGGTAKAAEALRDMATIGGEV